MCYLDKLQSSVRISVLLSLENNNYGFLFMTLGYLPLVDLCKLSNVGKLVPILNLSCLLPIYDLVQVQLDLYKNTHYLLEVADLSLSLSDMFVTLLPAFIVFNEEKFTHRYNTMSKKQV